jgi:hypothetical protein
LLRLEVIPHAVLCFTGEMEDEEEVSFSFFLVGWGVGGGEGLQLKVRLSSAPHIF